MTWEEKFYALRVLAFDSCLKMRSPGDWYVSLPGVELGGSGMLHGVGESGETPEQAVLKTWETVTNLHGTRYRYLVIDAMNKTRRHVKWNGFMWVDQPVPEEITR